jgi:tetratricopeptide (TPR) repeat protein
MALAMGDSGWTLSQQYAALVRFGLWDEAIALEAPAPGAPGLLAGYLYSRGVALAARGRIEEAQAMLAQLRELRAATPTDARAGANTLHDVLAVAEPIVAARIAATRQENDAAVALLEQAVAAQDRLAFDEPADWFFPARHLLGAQLLIAGRAAQAERAYREDLGRNPANGWALYGLVSSLRAQGRARAATAVLGDFKRAWRYADIRLPGSAFWFAGPDTTSCECQRPAGILGPATPITAPAGGS